MPESSRRSRVRILLVEDSPDDADLMTDALHNGNLPVEVLLVEDGEAAMDYMCRRGQYQDAARPDLILLDLYLPKKNGHEVLSELKDDPALRGIPVVILSSSDEERDYGKAYDLHANCCVPKPLDPEEFSEAVERIEQFWVTVASRNPRGRH